MNKFLLIFLFSIILFFVFLYKQPKYQNVPILENNSNQIYADIVIKQGFFSVYGFVAYEKTDNFKMICSSFFGKEFEIGSNINYFWFWTRKENILYFCDHKKVNKSRLRKIFYPEIIKGFLGIEENFEIEQKLYNNLIKIITLQDNKIKNHKIYENKVLILEADVLEFYGNLPRKIKINWIEENIIQEWTLSNIKINNNYNDWNMPEYDKKINLENY